MAKKYTKRSDYWRKQNRIKKDKEFAKKRNVEKAKITQYYIKKLMYTLFTSVVFFIFLSIYYKTILFFYISLFFLVLWSGIFALYKIRLRKIHMYWSIEKLQKIDPFLFEEYITNMFNKNGCKVNTSVASWDDWADSIWRDSQWNNIIIQTKRYSDRNTVGSPEIRNFIWSMNLYNVKKWFFVTTWYFSKPAIETVKSVSGELDITLIDKDKLNQILLKTFKK